MTSSRLPREIYEFLESRLESIEKVEILRYLRRAPGPIPHGELVRALPLDLDVADALLGELARVELVTAGPGRGPVELGPAAQTPLCEELLRLYEEDRLAVVSALSAFSVARIRSMAARTFSEAFVSKKKHSKDNL